MSWRDATRIGLNVEAMEDRLLMAGDVDVRVSNGTLIIQGDGDDNAILVRQGQRRNEFVVSGLETGGVDTEIDGLDSRTFRNVRNISIRMGAGDDQVFIEGISESRAVGSTSAGPLRGNLRVDLGSGDDSLRIGSIESPGGPVTLPEDCDEVDELFRENAFLPEGVELIDGGGISFGGTISQEAIEDGLLNENGEFEDIIVRRSIGRDVESQVSLSQILFDSYGDVATDEFGDVLSADGNGNLLEASGGPITIQQLGFDNLDDLFADADLDDIVFRPDTDNDGLVSVDVVDTLDGADDTLNTADDIDLAQDAPDNVEEGPLVTSPDVVITVTQNVTTEEDVPLSLSDLDYDLFGNIQTDAAGNVLDSFGDPIEDIDGNIVNIDDIGFTNLNEVFENPGLTLDEDGRVIAPPGAELADFLAEDCLNEIESIIVVDPDGDAGDTRGLLLTDFFVDVDDLAVSVDPDLVTPTGNPILNSGVQAPTRLNAIGQIANAVSVAGDLDIRGRAGNDFIEISNTYVGDDFTLRAGSGNDEVLVHATDDPDKPSLKVRDSVEIDLGDGNDILTLQDEEFRRPDSAEISGGRDTSTGGDRLVLENNSARARRRFRAFELFGDA